MQLTIENSTTWPLFWDVLPQKIEPQAARHLIKVVQERDHFMLGALANVRAAFGLRAARRMQRRYLLSGSAKLAALVRAWQSRNSRLNDCRDEDIVSLLEMANDLFAWKAAPERALAWPMLKRDGENYRIIHKLKLRQAAIDKLAANAARSVADLLPTQFNRKGVGVEKFEAWLAECMPKIQAVVTVDIPSCFDVIRRSSVEVSLLLPKRVVEAAMFHPMDKAKHLSGVHTGIATEHHHNVGTSAPKRSVPQASALAQLAADIEVDKVLREVAAVHGSVRVAAFGDNLIFLLQDAGWLESVKAALTDATTKQFGPDVTTALVERIQCDKPSNFTFCRRSYCWKKGKLRKTLPSGYVDAYQTKIMLATQDAYAQKSEIALDRCENSIKGFLAQHFKVQGVIGKCTELLCNVSDYRKLIVKKSLHGAL